jgi:hypothetical protein
MLSEEGRSEPSYPGEDVLQHLARQMSGGKCTKQWVNTGGAQIKLDFDISLPQRARIVCDSRLRSQSPLERPTSEISHAGCESQRLGITVSHVLVVELAVVVEVYKNGTGARMNLNPVRRGFYGACYNLQIAHRIPDEELSTYMLAKTELLPVYSDLQSGGPPGYDTLSSLRCEALTSRRVLQDAS